MFGFPHVEKLTQRVGSELPGRRLCQPRREPDTTRPSGPPNLVSKRGLERDAHLVHLYGCHTTMVCPYRSIPLLLQVR